MKKNIFAIAILGIFIANTFAQSSKQTVNELIEITGLNEDINQLDAIFDAKISENKSSFENELDFQKFSEVMRGSFNSVNTQKHITEYLIKNSEEDSIKKMINIYQNPIMHEMHKVELKASNPENQHEKLTFFQDMKANPLPKQRIQLFIDLNNELQASETTVRMLKNIIFSIANGVNMAQSKEKQITEGELKTKLQTQFSPSFSQQMTNQIVALSMYTYKDISDEKLAEYVNIWSEPIAKYYTKLIFEAYDYSFSIMGKEMGKNIEKIN